MAFLIRIKRGTLAQITAAAAVGGLNAGEQYLATDTGRVYVGLSTTTFAEVDVSALATTTTKGLMSAADKSKLDNIATGATRNPITVSAADPSGGSNGDIWIKTS